MSSFEQQFDDLPEDLQKMVCSKVVYKQPKELLDEIKARDVYNNIIKMVTIKNVKPTMNNMITVLTENLSDEEIAKINIEIKNLIDKSRQ
tara:strand:- start:652 stop:921 length:270 start_codon:yes stop_codon:yes gene_type:complete